MVIPGAMWSTIFIILSALPVWLEQSFPGAIWLTPLVGAILIVLKIWQVYKPADAPNLPPGVEAASVSVEEESKIKRLMVG